MKNTIQISIEVEDKHVMDELVARLSVVDYSGFEEKDRQLEAFIEEQFFSREQLEAILSTYHLHYTKTVIEDQNWNALWESNFQPVVVDDFCVIRAHFHPHFPNVLHNIVITPKMSFGTGHHATTYMMISEMSKLSFSGKWVADFGTGTGVLAILAEKLGSEVVWAIDYDDWSIENSKENVQKNDCARVTIDKAEGFVSKVEYDIILANINKNVILANIDGLFFGLKSGGEVLLSGLLVEDEADILASFNEKGFRHRSTVSRNNWICLLFEKALL